MEKELLIKAVNALKNISIDFRLESVMFQGEVQIRGIVLGNPDDVSKVKSILDSDFLKKIKFKKNKSWYLGDEKETVLMHLKEQMMMPISEVEKLHISNYA
jgi:hypothetical protein